jgi:hypothetical protein
VEQGTENNVEMVNLERLFFKGPDYGSGLQELTELTDSLHGGYDYSWARKRALLLRKCFWLIGEHQIKLGRSNDSAKAGSLLQRLWRTYGELVSCLRISLSDQHDALDQALVSFHQALEGCGKLKRPIGCLWNEELRRGRSHPNDDVRFVPNGTTCNFLRWGEKCLEHDMATDVVQPSAEDRSTGRGCDGEGWIGGTDGFTDVEIADMSFMRGLLYDWPI